MKSVYKILIFLVLVFSVFVVLAVGAAAASYDYQSFTVYSQGGVMSSTYTDFFDNFISAYPGYEYVYFRSGQYTYTCIVGLEMSRGYSGNDFYPSSVGGVGDVEASYYCINLNTYTGSSSSFSVDCYYLVDFDVYVNDGIIYSSSVTPSLVYILNTYYSYIIYILLFLLFFFVAFQFINKRWLLS